MPASDSQTFSLEFLLLFALRAQLSNYQPTEFPVRSRGFPSSLLLLCRM